MANDQRPAGPGNRRPLREFRATRNNMLGYFQNMAATYGDLSYVRFGMQKIFLFNHPDLIRDVLIQHNKHFAKSRGLIFAKKLLGDGLLTSEGEFHLQQRRMLQPLFHRERIATYGEVMAQYANQHQIAWRDGIEVDIAAEMMQLTLKIAGKTLFDTELHTRTEQLATALATAMELFPLFILPFASILDKLPIPMARRFQQAKRQMDDIIYEMIAEHRAGGSNRGDVLSMLLNARDAESPNQRMSDQQIRDEALTLLLAGHETTAIALSWTLDLLARHEIVLQKLQAEIDAELGDSPPAAADIARLPFTKMVFTEAMRLYPPAYIIGRQALTEIEIAHTCIPKGATILMSPYLIHHDARFYDQPEQFNPDRWRHKAIESLPKYAYFPFGGGARICIGEHFAWMEGILVLATMVQNWQFQAINPQPSSLDPSITLRPKGGVPMRILRRQKRSYAKSA